MIMNTINLPALNAKELIQINGGKAIVPPGSVVDAIITVVQVVNTLSDLYDNLTNTDPQTT